MPKPNENKGPKPVEIGIAAFLSLLLGVLGAGVFLVLQPAEKVSEMPDEEDRQLGRIYFIEGKGGNNSHDTWQAKEAAVKTSRSGNISLVEQELNRWAAAQEVEGEEIDGGLLYVAPGTPRFRMADDLLTVRVPLRWSAFGASRTFEAQTSGQFVRQGNQFVLSRDRVYVGSCPLPGPLANRLFNDVLASYNFPEELRNGWASLESVAVDGDSLKLVVP